LYIVVGHPGYYYCDGYFYCLRGTVWHVSQNPNRGWERASDMSVPRGLRVKGRGKHKKAF
jgi:hypothetical protein